MSNGTKQWVSGVLSLIGALIMTFAIARMVPPGLAGDFEKVKIYFALMMLGLFIALPAAMASVYLRTRGDDGQELARVRTEAAILAESAKKNIKKRNK